MDFRFLAFKSFKSNNYWFFLKKLIVIIIALGNINSCFSQIKSPFFRTLRVEQGLSHNKINKVLEDKRGFIWIATEDGLNRYDGRYFKIYKNIPGSNSGLGGNIINDIIEDNEGIIWIATADGGLSRYNFRANANTQFKQYSFTPGAKDGIPENNITALAENKEFIWLATSKSFVVRFNKQSGKFDTPVKTGTKAILTLKFISPDTLMVGRAGGGPLFINTKNLNYKQDIRYANLYGDAPYAAISQIFKDVQKRIWISSWDNKLYRYAKGVNLNNDTAEPIQIANVKNDEIKPFAQDKAGQIWMGSKNSGLIIFDGKNFNQFTYNQFKDGTIADDAVNTVFISRKGVVWVGTNNGLSIYNPLFSTFERYQLPHDRKDLVVYDFYRDKFQNLWIGTSEGLILQKSNSQVFEKRQISYNGQKLSVTKIFVDHDGTFYLGTDYSLFIYNKANNLITLLPNTEKDPVMKKLISSRIVSIVRDTLAGDPVLIVSPYGHYLTYYNIKQHRWISRSDKQADIIKKLNIKDNLIQKFFKDNSGDVWIATYNSGLGQWNTNKSNKIQYFGSDEHNKTKLRTSRVYDIVSGKKNGFWISTYGSGLNYFDSKSGSFKHVNESSNLSEGMEKDENGKLWMIANGHIHMFEPATQIYSCYTIPGYEKLGGFKGYIYKDDKNRLYAASLNSFVVFDPQKIERIQNEPKIYLTDFQVFNTSYNQYLQNKEINLDYKQNYFSVEFSAPDFSGDNVFYSYKMEGLEKDWTQAGKRNFANYANLPGGKYIFKVRATNWQTDKIKNFASVVIIINPPYWTKWWFYLLILIMIAGLGVMLYFFRIGELLKRQAIRNGIAQDLHDSVGSTLSSILVYTEVAKNHQKQERSAQLSNVLGSIETVSTEMISEMTDIVWAINPKNDHFRGIVDRIKAYGLPLCEASSIELLLNIDPKIFDLALEMNTRKNLYLIIKEAITNAVKYADCSKIEVDINYTGKKINVKVSDNGKGFKTEHINCILSSSLSGNGLENLKTRAEELKGDLNIFSEPDKGTIILLVFSL